MQLRGPVAERQPQADALRNQPQADPLRRQQDLFERLPTLKLPARPDSAPAAKTAKATRPEPTELHRMDAVQARPQAARSRPEATQLLPDQQVATGLGPGQKEEGAQRERSLAFTARLMKEGLQRGSLSFAGKVASAAAESLSGMELGAQMRRISNPSPLWNAAARGLGALSDAMQSASSRWSRGAEGMRAAQQFAEGGKLSQPKPAEAAAQARDGAADWKRAGAGFNRASEMLGCLSVADDAGARAAAGDLISLLHAHSKANPADADAAHSLRQVADAAASLGAARDPADAAQAAKSLRAAGKQVRQLFAERGGGASSVNTAQAATLQRLTRTVRAGDEAADAFRRGDHRGLAAIGAEIASTLSKGGGSKAAQALAVRERAQDLLAATSGQPGSADPTSAAKRLHVAIRQAQAGAQWEREKLLQSLGPAAQAA